ATTMSFRRASLTAFVVMIVCALPEFCAAQGTYNQGTYNNQGQYNNQQTVTCSARRNSSTRKYCAADTENATVTLQRQTSNSACTQGSTWGFDDEGIWVSGGCGGTFAVNPNNSGYNNGNYGNNSGSNNTGQTIRCTAKNRSND